MARRRAVQFMVGLTKARPCQYCGGSFPMVCMDYDHRPGTVKADDVGHLAHVGWRQALAEIDKCDLVCANCHRVRTNDRAAAG